MLPFGLVWDQYLHAVYIVRGDTYSDDEGTAIHFIDGDNLWPDLVDGQNWTASARFVSGELSKGLTIVQGTGTNKQLLLEFTEEETLSFGPSDTRYVLQFIRTYDGDVEHKQTLRIGGLIPITNPA